MKNKHEWGFTTGLIFALGIVAVGVLLLCSILYVPRNQGMQIVWDASATILGSVVIGFALVPTLLEFVSALQEKKKFKLWWSLSWSLFLLYVFFNRGFH